MDKNSHTPSEFTSLVARLCAEQRWRINNHHRSNPRDKDELINSTPEQAVLGQAVSSWDAKACQVALEQGANPLAPWRGKSMVQHWLDSLKLHGTSMEGSSNSRATQTLLWLDGQHALDKNVLTDKPPMGPTSAFAGPELRQSRLRAIAELIDSGSLDRSIPPLVALARHWSLDQDPQSHVGIDDWMSRLVVSSATCKTNSEHRLSLAIALSNDVGGGFEWEIWSSAINLALTRRSFSTHTLISMVRLLGPIDPHWKGALHHKALLLAIVSNNLDLLEILGRDARLIPVAIDLDPLMQKCVEMHMGARLHAGLHPERTTLHGFPSLLLTLIGAKGAAGDVTDWKGPPFYEALLGIPGMKKVAQTHPHSTIFVGASINLIRSLHKHIPDILAPDSEGRIYAHQWAMEPSRVDDGMNGVERLSTLLASKSLCDDAQLADHAGKTPLSIVFGRSDLHRRDLIMLEQAIAAMEAKTFKADTVRTAKRRIPGGASRL